MSETNKPVESRELPDGGRELRGRQLATIGAIQRIGRQWKVPSQTQASSGYLVDIEESACTCPDYELRKGTCKHQHAVLFWIAWGRDVAAEIFEIANHDPHPVQDRVHKSHEALRSRPDIRANQALSADNFC